MRRREANGAGLGAAESDGRGISDAASIRCSYLRNSGFGSVSNVGRVGYVGRAGTRTLGARTKLKCGERDRARQGAIMVRELPSPGATIAWADVIVTSSPPFARPLRTRVGGDAMKLDGEGAEVALALAATAEGRGELAVLARAVVCAPKAQGGGCRPVSVEAAAEVMSGAVFGEDLALTYLVVGIVMHLAMRWPQAVASSPRWLPPDNLPDGRLHSTSRGAHLRATFRNDPGGCPRGPLRARVSGLFRLTEPSGSRRLGCTRSTFRKEPSSGSIPIKVAPLGEILRQRGFWDGAMQRRVGICLLSPSRRIGEFLID